MVKGFLVSGVGSMSRGKIHMNHHWADRGDYNSDYSVLYEWVEGGVVRQHEKDAWNFQVRYTHIADLKVR